jgi:hypothetical protein
MAWRLHSSFDLIQTMKQRIRAARDFLGQAQHQDGGWPYRMNEQNSPEPTCYGILALAMTDRQSMSDISLIQARIDKGIQWLVSRVNDRGALTLEGDDEPHWSTSLFVITLSRLQTSVNESARGASNIGERSIQWLLSWQGNTSPPQETVTLNSQLRGWPWISDTFSWVEPTSYAVLALKLSGHQQHPRVHEAEELLLDRACQTGGWNYGNRVVLGRTLVPFPLPTAMATLALQDVPSAHERIDRALTFLRREVSQHPSTLSLALGIHCFHVFGQPMDEFVNALANRQHTDGSWRQSVHLTALATLALDCATGGHNVFKL